MVNKKKTGPRRTVAKRKRHAAFISAPFFIDTNVLVQVLKDRDVEPIRLDEMESGQRLQELVRKSINRADFVIAVLGDLNPNVLFELGVATGLGKHVLVLGSPKHLMPADLAGMTYLRADPADPRDREAIEFGLDQLLSAPSSKRTPQVSRGRKTRAIGKSADKLMEELKILREDNGGREADLVRIISEAIEKSGVSTVSKESPLRSARTGDLAVWSDDLEPWIGNPMIIQVKQRLTSKRDLEKAIQDLSTALDETRSRRCLLVYLDAKPAILYGSLYDPRIIVLSAEELIGGLKEVGLGDLLRRTRNEYAQLRG